MRIQVLFVCLGNICRSPMAEGIFRRMVEERSLSDLIGCDSAGTSAYHIGSLPDERMRDTALKNSIKLTHLGRQLDKSDFSNFDYILAMDALNLQNIQFFKTSVSKAKIFRMRQFERPNVFADVPDPYYGGKEGFDEVYGILHQCCFNFLNYLIEENKLNEGTN